MWWLGLSLHDCITNVDSCEKIELTVAVPQIYKGDPSPHIPPCVMASSAMGLKLGVFGFLLTTHAKTNTKQICSWSSRVMWHFTHIYLHSQTAVDAGDYAPDKSWLFWLQENPEDPQFEPHAGIKMAHPRISVGHTWECRLVFFCTWFSFISNSTLVGPWLCIRCIHFGNRLDKDAKERNLSISYSEEIVGFRIHNEGYQIFKSNKRNMGFLSCNLQILQI